MTKNEQCTEQFLIRPYTKASAAAICVTGHYNMHCPLGHSSSIMLSLL